MAAIAKMPVHILLRVGDSEVLNEVGSFDLDVKASPIDPDSRQSGDAAEAVMRVTVFDLARALREAADAIDPPALAPDPNLG